jgi:hypothetical protein
MNRRRLTIAAALPLGLVAVGASQRSVGFLRVPVEVRP